MAYKIKDDGKLPKEGNAEVDINLSKFNNIRADKPNALVFRVTDSAGNVAVSDPVYFTIRQQFSVKIVHPKGEYPEGELVPLRAEINQGMSPYTYEFFIDGNALGPRRQTNDAIIQSQLPPQLFAPNNLGPGKHELTITVEDHQGAKTADRAEFEIKTGTAMDFDIISPTKKEWNEGEEIPFAIQIKNGKEPYAIFAYVNSETRTSENAIFAKIDIQGLTDNTFALEHAYAKILDMLKRGVLKRGKEFVVYIEVNDGVNSQENKARFQRIKPITLTIAPSGKLMINVVAPAENQLIPQNEPISFDFTIVNGQPPYQYVIRARNQRRSIDFSKEGENITNPHFDFAIAHSFPEGDERLTIAVIDSLKRTVQVDRNIKIVSPVDILTVNIASPTEEQVVQKELPVDLEFTVLEGKEPYTCELLIVGEGRREVYKKSWKANNALVHEQVLLTTYEGKAEILLRITDANQRKGIARRKFVVFSMYKPTPPLLPPPPGTDDTIPQDPDQKSPFRITDVKSGAAIQKLLKDYQATEERLRKHRAYLDSFSSDEELMQDPALQVYLKRIIEAEQRVQQGYELIRGKRYAEAENQLKIIQRILGFLDDSLEKVKSIVKAFRETKGPEELVRALQQIEEKLNYHQKLVTEVETHEDIKKSHVVIQYALNLRDAFTKLRECKELVRGKNYQYAQRRFRLLLHRVQYLDRAEQKIRVILQAKLTQQIEELTNVKLTQRDLSKAVNKIIQQLTFYGTLFSELTREHPEVTSNELYASLRTNIDQGLRLAQETRELIAQNNFEKAKDNIGQFRGRLQYIQELYDRILNGIALPEAWNGNVADLEEELRINWQGLGSVKRLITDLRNKYRDIDSNPSFKTFTRLFDDEAEPKVRRARDLLAEKRYAEVRKYLDDLVPLFDQLNTFYEMFMKQINPRHTPSNRPPFVKKK
ncbi:hypothetical protein C4573_02770 [Candidatus Woesearchaeota archaeon]|nr:MAG: hypothetical protein C4573_02770 [Candidatus Woesearchaeota archaeon]